MSLDLVCTIVLLCFFFFFQAEDGIRDYKVTGVQTCALPILRHVRSRASQESGRMVTSAIRLWTAATFEVAKRKIPGASRFRVSTAARQARRAWSRFAADAPARSTSRSTSRLSYPPELERPNPARRH